jgi:hypothetical protein
MNPSDVAPMIVGVTLILVGGGVALLRPIAKRLGAYLETVTRAKRDEPKPVIDERMVETLERIEQRLRLVEERQDFTDALLSRQKARELEPDSGPGAERRLRAGADMLDYPGPG